MIILYILLYFFFTFSLSKIAENEEMDWDDALWAMLMLIPPIYLLYITRRFNLMIFITWLTYILAIFLVNKWISPQIASTTFLIPLTISFVYILYNLKLPLKLSLLNIFPPILWTFILIWYLALYHNPSEDEKNEILNKKIIPQKKPHHKITKKSNFHTLNQNLFKSFEPIDYDTINIDDKLWWRLN